MEKLKITLVRSLIGHRHQFRDIAKSLGLGKMNSHVVHEKNPSLMGKIKKIEHLLKVEEAK